MKAKQANLPKTVRFSVAVAAGLWASTYATASLALGTVEERIACTPDVFRLCSSEIPNVDQIISCMKAKKTSLSQACRTVFGSRLARATVVEPAAPAN